MADKGLFEEALSRVGLDLTRAANLLRQLSNLYLLDSRIIDVVIPTGEFFTYQPHGLGRPHQAAVVVGQDSDGYEAHTGLPGYDHTRVYVHIDAAQTRPVRIKLLVM